MNREIVLKLKLLALDEMKHPPMTDVRGFRPSEKRKLLALIEAKFASMSLTEIDEAFNQLVCEDVLSAKADVSKYHVDVFALGEAQQGGSAPATPEGSSLPDAEENISA